MDELTLNPEEKKAVAALKRLAARWPKTLWLFTNGTLYVVKTKDGKRVMTERGCAVDEKFIVTSVDIPSDGGDF